MKTNASPPRFPHALCADKVEANRKVQFVRGRLALTEIPEEDEEIEYGLVVVDEAHHMYRDPEMISVVDSHITRLDRLNLLVARVARKNADSILSGVLNRQHTLKRGTMRLLPTDAPQCVSSSRIPTELDKGRVDTSK
jgi:hypothetical protein